jgi:hypothetical protein
MILLVVPLGLVFVGLLLGGRLAALKTLPIRWGALPLLAVGAQWLLVRVPGDDPAPWLGAAFVASYTLLVGFLLINRHLPGLKLALVGTLLNLAVILANGGFMPIAPETFAGAFPERPALQVGQRVPLSKDLALAPEQARLGGLGDSLVLRWPFRSIFSLGDLLLAAGVGALVLRGMQPRRGRWRRSPAVRELARTHIPGP